MLFQGLGQTGIDRELQTSISDKLFSRWKVQVEQLFLWVQVQAGFKFFLWQHVQGLKEVIGQGIGLFIGRDALGLGQFPHKSWSGRA